MISFQFLESIFLISDSWILPFFSFASFSHISMKKRASKYVCSDTPHIHTTCYKILFEFTYSFMTLRWLQNNGDHIILPYHFFSPCKFYRKFYMYHFLSNFHLKIISFRQKRKEQVCNKYSSRNCRRSNFSAFHAITNTSEQEFEEIYKNWPKI